MRESESEVPRPQIQQGGEIPYLGERLVLDMSAEAGRTRPFVSRRGEELRVVLPADADPRNALEAWYRRQARSEVAVRLDAAVARAGRGYTTLQIRGQRTRWASCSTSGAMSFNWRLLLGPEEVLDYVVWHEACHLVVMDHSRRFWTLLERHRPGYRAPQRWLRANGTALVLPG
jgi:predicted metal-dependent hydrolase